MLKSNALEERRGGRFSFITGITRPQVEKLLREESLQSWTFRQRSQGSAGGCRSLHIPP